MIKVFLSRAKKQLTPKISIKSIIKESKERSESSDIRENIDKAEFEKRYNNLYITLWIILASILYCLYIVVTHLNVMGVSMGILSALIASVFYTRYIYNAWSARVTYKNWGTDVSKKSINQFIDVLISNPSNIFPKRIDK